jgi:hypothetical protein
MTYQTQGIRKPTGGMMDDYGKFCYLDVQKTGSTFISRFLRNCSLIPELKTEKHGVVRERGIKNVFGVLGSAGFHRDDTFYFNSVRNPFSYYASLYNYGCDKRGGVYLGLKKAGKDEFYDGTRDGFHGWLDFVMTPENATFVDRDYARLGRPGIGSFTFRFLRLSVAAPTRKLASVSTVEDASELLDNENICLFTVRNESLTDDLAELALERLNQYFDDEKTKAYLLQDKVNVSRSKAVGVSDFEDYPDLDRFIEKERLIFDLFYRSSI